MEGSRDLPFGAPRTTGNTSSTYRSSGASDVDGSLRDGSLHRHVDIELGATEFQSEAVRLAATTSEPSGVNTSATQNSTVEEAAAAAEAEIAVQKGKPGGR